MRRTRVDANQPDIVSALRKAGAFVRDMHGAGDGFPDIVAAFRGRWHFFEVKSSDAAARRKGLTAERQAHFREQADARGCVVHVVTTPEEAARCLFQGDWAAATNIPARTPDA